MLWALQLKLADYSGGGIMVNGVLLLTSLRFLQEQIPSTATLRTDGSSKFAKAYRWGWSRHCHWMEHQQRAVMENADRPQVPYQLRKDR